MAHMQALFQKISDKTNFFVTTYDLVHDKIKCTLKFKLYVY